MAEYVIKEIDFEDLENISVGWDESAYDDVDIMLIKSFILNELEREYGEGTILKCIPWVISLKKWKTSLGNQFHPKTYLSTKWLVSWTVSSAKR